MSKTTILEMLAYGEKTRITKGAEHKRICREAVSKRVPGIAPVRMVCGCGCKVKGVKGAGK